MDAVETLKSLFDVGGVVVVTFMLWIVWRRLNEHTDRFIDILNELRMARVTQQLAPAMEPARKDNHPT